jgi:outer membrane protein assembly factor BamA
MSAGFTFSKSTQNRSKERQSFYTYRGSIETAGNLLQGICAAANAPKKDGSYTILNIRFAQYVKGEFDFAYNHVINSKNRLVYHFNVGLAYPYGNETVVPFEKRFYAGGANSVRGWSVRSLGPGGYVTNSKRKDFNQTGDIKLDLNIEYRFKLFWVLDGAAFLDAGNIWTIHEYETQKGGVFKFDEFYKQIAFSYGLGLRFDFDFFILRCDLGAQLYDPTKKGREQWRNLEWDNMAFHLAIGYPF